MPELLRRFIALVSRLAPRWARREFRAEWEAELAMASRQATPSWRGTARLARLGLGAIPDAWTLSRQHWSPDMIMQDVRYALRLLRRRPGYATIILLTLAIGIGANTAVFTAIDAVLLRPLPLPDPDRLVMVWENDRLNHKTHYFVAPANFADWRDQARAFESVTAYNRQSGTIAAGSEPFRAQLAAVTPNFFEVLGAPAALGRTLTESDGVAPNNRVLVLSHALWVAHFGADPAAVGRTVKYADLDFRIVGVMPESFAMPDRTVEVWRPIVMRPEFFAVRAQHYLEVIGRIRRGTTLAQARADLERVAIAAQAKYPQTNQQRGTTMMPLRDALVGDVRAPMYFLGAAVALLLLVGCANVANLMLAQGTVRRRELALRAALGADRMRIARQLLVEGLILAIAGGLAGVALASWSTRLLARVALDYVPRVDTMAMDRWVLGYAVVLSLVTGLISALAPALRAARADVQADLREGARGTSAGGRRLRHALIIIEFAAAVVLVVGATLLLESFWRLVRVQPRVHDRAGPDRGHRLPESPAV